MVRFTQPILNFVCCQQISEMAEARCIKFCVNLEYVTVSIGMTKYSLMGVVMVI